MSDYNRQLHAWAVERVLTAKTAGVLDISGMDELKAAADELASYCYNPMADLGSVCDYIGDKARTLDPKDAVEALESVIRGANILLEQAQAQVVENEKWAAAAATQPDEAPSEA